MVADHYSRAASLGAAADLERDELQVIRARALEALEAAGDASAAFYSNSEAQGHYEAALAVGGELERETIARVSEKLGDVALRLGRVDRAVRAWDRCMEYHRGEENLARVGDLHRKIGAGLWQKGDREASIEHYQRGIDLLKDGQPCLELVRLYEEAASLYMHTGDNMLAIYASEKALRLAERLGEAGAASRAHGIFGRVFGRIGDSERARENLERSVELARETDPAEAVRALFALGYHLEVSEADYEGGARDLPRGPRSGARDGRPPVAGRGPRGPRPDRHLRRRLGGGRARDRRVAGARRARGSGRQALLPLLDARRPALARRRARRVGRGARARV